jgi:transcriptional regulator with XRE-family HTH domain
VTLGISQLELGRKLAPQVSASTISQWENENSTPSENYKAQISRILGHISTNIESKNSPVTENEEPIEGPSAIGAWLNRHRLEQRLSVPELAERAELSPVAIYNIESGRSQNPQNNTVAKLETALGRRLSPEAKKEVRDEATIEGVGEWFNFDPSSRADWPTAAGVYVLYDISDRPIYVGQGQKISNRLDEHHQKFWFRPPIVQNAAYVGIDNKELRERIEKVLIKFLKSNAVLNQQNVDR